MVQPGQQSNFLSITDSLGLERNHVRPVRQSGPLTGCLWDEPTLWIILHSFYRGALMDGNPFFVRHECEWGNIQMRFETERTV